MILPAIILSICFLILTALEAAYLPIARREGWTTAHNVREDGHPVTVVGAGFIFYVAMILWSFSASIFYNVDAPGSYFLLGLTMLAATSFADDVMGLKVWVRLAVQLIAVLFLCFEFPVFTTDFWLVLLFIFCVIGFINAYNFMDGINGMTGSYSIVALCSFLCINNFMGMHFTSGTYIIYALMGAVIFTFCNFRRRAIAFAGDVGSISMGYIVAVLLAQFILYVGDASPIVLVAVYTTDTLATVIRRLIEGENIFTGHRKHIYEQLHFNRRVSQLKISSIYSLLQLCISCGYLMTLRISPETSRFYTLAVYSLLVLLYICMLIPLSRKRAE